MKGNELLLEEKERRGNQLKAEKMEVSELNIENMVR